MNTQFQISESDTTVTQTSTDSRDEPAHTLEKGLSTILGDMFDTKLAPLMRELVKLKNTLSMTQETIKNVTQNSPVETKDLGTLDKTSYTGSMSIPKRSLQTDWIPSISMAIAIIGVILTVMQIQYQSTHDSIEAFKSEVLTEIKSLNSKVDMTNQMFNQRLDDQNRYIDKVTERKAP